MRKQWIPGPSLSLNFRVEGPGYEASSSCSAVVFNEWLVVTGGEATGRRTLSSVEVMNIDAKQWYDGPSTPIPWSHMRTAVVGDTCYFMGGYVNEAAIKKMYTVSLSALTSGLTSKEPWKNKRPMWEELSGMYYAYSTPVIFRGSLLTVGGRGENMNLYQPDTGKWVKVGDLPTPRQNCICAMITDKEMLVAGGHDGRNTLKKTDIALLQYK